MRRLAVVAMAVASGAWGQQASAQGQAPAPVLSPQAAYDDSTRPVEIVRKSVANWSEVEQYALAVAMKKAALACGERRTTVYAGDELVALSKLCAFGQQWPDSKTAAAKYIAAVVTADGPAKTQLALAYGLQLDADLHLHGLDEIMKDAKAMLAGVAYDATVNDACDVAITYLQLAYTKEALELQAVRQPLLLKVLSSEKPVVPRRALYASGLAQAELLQYVDKPEEAEASVAALDAALVAQVGDEAKLSADDLVPIGEARKQYGLLGKPLPKLTLAMSLTNPNEVPALDPKFGAGTAFLLFPDWCAQCVAMHGELWKAAQTKQGVVRLFVLLAEATPNKDAMIAAIKARDAQLEGLRTHTALPDTPKPEVPEKPKTAAELMVGTQTYVVPPETLATFAAGDFPFVVMVDYAGIVRFAGSGTETMLKAGDFLDRLVEHVAETWMPPDAKKN
jgi:hypothetical protein